MVKHLSKIRASRSLLRQVFFEGPGGCFFSSVFSISFLDGFLVDFGRVLETNMRRKIDFWRVFCNVFLAPSFCSLFLMHFDGFFKAQLLENSDFTYVKCIFLRFYMFGTCLARGSKMHTNIDEFSGRKSKKIDAKTHCKNQVFPTSIFH